MDREHTKKRNVIILRCVCIALILFSLALGCTFRKTGYCWGDQLFAALGLPAWSNGSQGIHYPGIIAILLLVLSCGVFAATFQKRKQLVFWCLVAGIAGIGAILSFLLPLGA